MSKLVKKKQIEEALEQINEWNKELEPSVKNGKFKKMARSPYYFLRGTNHLYWKYFSEDKRLKKFSPKKAQTWIQADLHAYNYGIYSDNKGELIYGLNDFDEACIANYQFDLWRMAASMVLIARENEFFEKLEILAFISSFTDAYVNLFLEHLAKGEDTLFQVTKKSAYGKLDETIEHIEKHESRKEMLEKWTKVENGNLVFDLAHEKLKALEQEKILEIKQALPAYLETLHNQKNFNREYFEVLDIAHRISSGTGSYGTPRYYILIRGEINGEYEQRILDAKLQQKPSPYLFLSEKFKANYDMQFENEGQRHKEAYLALNCYTDRHLGWMKLSEGVFSVRERSPFKAYFETKVLSSTTRFNKIAQQWGRILATSHIRAGEDFDILGVLNLIKKKRIDFNNLVAEIAFEYAEFNNVVYKNFMNKLFLDE